MKSHINLKTKVIINNFRVLMTIIFPLITMPYVSRILQVENMGKVYFGNSILNIFLMFCNMGIPNYGTREIAKAKDDKELFSRKFTEIFIINLIATMVSILVYVIVVTLTPTMNKEYSLFLILGFNMIFNLLGVNWLYQATENYVLITIRTLVFQIVSILLMVILIHKPNDYVKYALVLVISSGASNIFNFLYRRKIVKCINYHQISVKSLLGHIKPILILFASSAAITLYTNFTTTFLGFFKNNVEVGYYSTSTNIIRIIVTVITSISTVLLARTSLYFSKSMINEYNDLNKKAFNFILFLCLPICLVCFLGSFDIITFLCGSTYEKSSIILKILSPEIIIISFTQFMVLQILLPKNKEKILLYGVLGGVMISFLVSTVTVFYLGSIGVAIANLMSEIFVFIFLLYKCLSEMKIIIYKFSFSRYLFATIALALVYVLISNNLEQGFISLSISSFISIVTYYIILLYLKDETAKEILDFINAFVKKYDYKFFQ